jgi:stage V sporulation protein D (sporulation-specific penicillin-binding protein)
VEPNYTEAEIAGLDRTTPNVLGSTPTSAATVLKSSSLSYRTIGKGDKVTMQIPPAGSTLPKDGTVWLYTEPTDPEKTTVPDFNGLTVAQVKQLAKQKGLNVLMTGVSSTGGTPKASRQSVEAETEVNKGTVMKVEFTYADNIH